MCRKCAWVTALGLGFAAVVNANSAPPRAEDPDWPCQQRLVPKLTAAAYWNGPPLESLGDWRADPKKFPNGLAPVSDYAHSKGLKFGLWVGWTQVGNSPGFREDSRRVVSTADLPRVDWLSDSLTDGWKPGEFWGETICLADTQARDWCLDLLRAVVKDNKLGTLVGQPTGGNQRGINGGAFFFATLPNSKIEVDLPLIAAFPDGPPPDGKALPFAGVPRPDPSSSSRVAATPTGNPAGYSRLAQGRARNRRGDYEAPEPHRPRLRRPYRRGGESPR